MTPTMLLSAALAFAAVMVIGVATRRRDAARPAPANGPLWREPGKGDATPDTRALAQRLEMAGFNMPNAPAVFRAARIVCLLAAVAGGAMAGLSLLEEPLGALFASALAGLLGWRLPVGWLESRLDRCRFELRSDFPVMLDLLQISMQGGMGLHAAWSATTSSLDSAGDALGREMRRVDMAVGLGVPWGTALAEAADRTGVDEFRSLGSLLGQTQRFGTGVADMIRVLCDSLRHDEVQNLEEHAHRRSVRMVMVLAGMLLPATLLIVVAPLLLMLLDAFKEVTAD
jgi:tight adherence protein C